MKRVSQYLQTIIKGKGPGVLPGRFVPSLAFTRAEYLANHERAVLLLQGVRPGKGVLNGKARRIARINTGHKRVNGVVQKFLTDPADHEISHALFV